MAIKRILKDKSGMVMILTLLVMLLLFALGTVMLAAAGSSAGEADAAVKQEQAYFNCYSMGEYIKDDLSSGGSIAQAADALNSANTTLELSMTLDEMGTIYATGTLSGDRLDFVIENSVSGTGYRLKLSFEKVDQSWNAVGYSSGE